MPALENPIDEAKRILALADERKIVLRLFGGIAFRLRSPSADNPGLARNYVDVDFVGHAKQAGGIKQLLENLGYVPRERFNAMQGYRRLIFNDIEHQRRIDIFLDVFEMCHKFNFKDRLEIDKITLSLADLLATKLQIVEINEKDLQDILSLLIDHEVGNGDAADTINGAYLAKLCSDDWGVYRTFIINLERVTAAADLFQLEDSKKQHVLARVGEFRKMIEDVPKSLRWRMRSKVGERVQWYELPEADKEVVDSRMSGEAVG